MKETLPECLWLCRCKGRGDYLLYAGCDPPVRTPDGLSWMLGKRCRFIGHWAAKQRANCMYGWHPYLRKGAGPIEVDMLKLIHIKNALPSRPNSTRVTE